MTETKPLKIITVNNPEELAILREKSRPLTVEEIKSPEIQEFIDQLYATLLPEKYGVGLAASQVGKSLRLFLAENEDTGRGGEKKIAVFINPEIDIEDFTQEIDTEGCLSIPKTWGKVPRYSKIKVRYYDREGNKQTAKYEGFIARLIQHENDHLDGVLFTDKLVK